MSIFTTVCYTLLAGFVINSCASSKGGGNNITVEKLNLNATGSAINKIAFLTFRITAKDTLKDLFDVKLINTIFAEGVLKKNDGSAAVIEPNYLYYQIGTVKAKDKHFERIENPLSRVFEFSSDDGKLGKKTISNNTGELVIRFQYDQSSKSISIFKPDRHSLKLKPIYNATF